MEEILVAMEVYELPPKDLTVRGFLGWLICVATFQHPWKDEVATDEFTVKSRTCSRCGRTQIELTTQWARHE